MSIHDVFDLIKDEKRRKRQRRNVEIVLSIVLLVGAIVLGVAAWLMRS